MKRARTFAELVAEAAAERPAAHEVDRVALPGPGEFDGDGGLTDPDARRLTRVGAISPKQARLAVEAGALLAFEGCGCGGYVGCQPDWIDAETRARLVGGPRFAKGHGSSTWIDRWRGEGVEVVLAHGDVVWPLTPSE